MEDIIYLKASTPSNKYEWIELHLTILSYVSIKGYESLELIYLNVEITLD